MCKNNNETTTTLTSYNSKRTSKVLPLSPLSLTGWYGKGSRDVPCLALPCWVLGTGYGATVDRLRSTYRTAVKFVKVAKVALDLHEYMLSL